LINTDFLQAPMAFVFLLRNQLNLGDTISYYLAYHTQLLLVAVPILYISSLFLSNIFKRISFYIFLLIVSIILYTVVIYNIRIGDINLFEAFRYMTLFSILFTINVLISSVICVLLRISQNKTTLIL